MYLILSSNRSRHLLRSHPFIFLFSLSILLTFHPSFLIKLFYLTLNLRKKNTLHSNIKLNISIVKQSFFIYIHSKLLYLIPATSLFNCSCSFSFGRLAEAASHILKEFEDVYMMHSKLLFLSMHMYI